MGIDSGLYSPKVKASRRDNPTDDAEDFHGSCVLSKAIGTINGVYKNAINLRYRNSRIVPVKIATTLDFGEVFWAWSAVRTDMKNSGPATPAVILFAIASEPNPDPIKHAAIKVIMQQIFDLGGSIVVSSGNHAQRGRPDVDSLPASWEAPTFPLIVVGAVDDAGFKAPDSQGPSHVSIYAPGVSVQCAGRYGFQRVSGTSASAGMVSHLLWISITRLYLYSY